MATNTYVALDKITVTTATNAVTFISIPGTYTDLRIIVDGTAASSSYCTLRFNGDTNTNYSNTEIVGDGSTTPGSYRNSGNPYGYSGSIYTSQTNNVIDILNYSNSATNKTYLHKASNSASGGSIKQSIGLWRSTSAITSITVGTGGGANFNVGTTFSLYGIKAWAPEVTPKATGGYVYEDSTYYYHAFPFSGTFTPSQSLTCDYLVVAGGAGGGLDRGGGGGAGGLRSTITATGGGGSLETPLSLSATNYTVTIGAGGGPSVWTSTYAQGNNTTFHTITSTGGGAGGNAGNGYPGFAGGSGGGASFRTNHPGGAGTANQGYAGGNSQVAADAGSGAGGGGGGAGAVGQSSPSLNVPGNGGNGVQINSITSATGFGINGYFAGGGGGGANGTVRSTGGLGGGGNGELGTAQSKNGAVNTGSGGGGNGDIINGSIGGSGIVVIRYAK
jgi:hypothetical protein